MTQHLYELLWELSTDVGGFYHSELRIFHSDVEARRYGKTRQRELNSGLTMEAQALQGYYYKYCGALEVEEIDSYQIALVEASR